MVAGASSAVAAVPSDAVWFATTPVHEYLFLRIAFYFIFYQAAVWFLVVMEARISAGLESLLGSAITTYCFAVAAPASPAAVRRITNETEQRRSPRRRPRTAYESLMT